MSDVTRVLLLTPYGRPVIGGISRFVDYLSLALADAGGWCVTVLSRFGQDASGSLIGFLAKSFIRVLTERPEVVHAHGHWYTIAAPVLLQFLRIRPRLVFSFHTMPPDSHAMRFGPVFEWLLAHCDRVTFVSDSLERQVRGLLHISPATSILSPGVPIPDFTPARPTNHVLGFAGPLTWSGKAAGVRILLEVVQKLRSDYPALRLLIAGSGRYLDDLRHIAADKGVSASVTFLGAVEEMDSFWSSVSVYAHVSLQEGMPLSLLEAMSRERPVLATSVGGIPEVIADGVNGILVSPEVESVVSGLRRLLSSPTLTAQVARQARRTIEERFGLSRLALAASEAYGPEKASEGGRR